MIVCPDCFTKIDPFVNTTCLQCGWLLGIDEGIINMLSTEDRKNSLFRQYVDLYETIAKAELSAPVNADTYVKSMASRTASLLGNIEGKNVCDIGSGKGFLLEEILKKKPDRLTAIDIATNYLKQNQAPGVTKMVANAENLPFEEEFDIAVSTDVMEHVLNVGSFMFRINKMLKNDGLFLVRVPYRENLMQYGRQEKGPYPFTHLRTYNLDLLKHQVKQAGFQPIKVVFDGFQPAYPRWFFQSGLGKAIFNKIVNDRYPDYWSVTSISAYVGFVLMRPIEVNMMCRKVSRLATTRGMSESASIDETST